MTVLANSGFLFWTLTVIGMLFDNSSLAWTIELLRSVVFLTVYYIKGPWIDFKIPSAILTATFSVSIIISLVAISVTHRKKTK